MAALFSKYKDWIADVKRMELAKPDARYMHCLPCERGYEVEDAVLDGKWGVTAFDEAENRLRAQKGVMASIIPWHADQSERKDQKSSIMEQSRFGCYLRNALNRPEPGL
jgi:aspartate carbamoyltransferase catalytic subunit